MNPLSPVDALSPAFSRARTILTRPSPWPGRPSPFRFWFFLKIAVVAALTQPNIYGMLFGVFFEFLAVGSGVLGALSHHAIHPSALHPVLFGALAVALFVLALLVVFFAWVWCRLRFTLFDLVLYRHGRVARAWTPYRSQAWRFFGLMVVVALALLLLLAVTAGPLLLHLILTVRHMNPQQINRDPAFLFSTIFPMYGIMFLFMLVALVADAVTQDFILPPMALEDAPLGLSFARFFAYLRQRFGSFLGYLLLRFVLELGLSWIGGMALMVVLFLAGGTGVGIGVVLFRAFWHTGPGGIALFVLYCLFAGAILVAAYLLLCMALYGTVAVIKESYAIYYYGGHYPPLGDRLDPQETPLATSATPPPAAPLPPFEPPSIIG
ncbi:MAG TPA: hypothetical protein VHU89_17680 [Acidobacteriaceae bacterium]|jgi:hypothetical protein|nr:hypothetical protein [Acidobacteriaceae bacterium]